MRIHCMMPGNERITVWQIIWKILVLCIGANQILHLQVVGDSVLQEYKDSKPAAAPKTYRSVRKPGVLEWIQRRKKEEFIAHLRAPVEESYWDGGDFIIKVSNKDTFKVRRAPVPKFGSPWPLPQFYKSSPVIFMLDQESFQFRAVKQSCDVLEEAFKRYRRLIIDHFGVTLGPTDQIERKLQQSGKVSLLSQVDVAVTKPCTEYPSLEMNEEYTLHISEVGAFISANESWGALRGLETFSQLVYQIGENKLFINKTVIRDFPRFKHRGVLIDTARHFLHKRTLLRNLDAMAYNKMNVMHWHIVDDQSFPFESRVFPNLTLKGAYDPRTHIYTHEDIGEIIEYARLRGIRVIPEFDTPGHVRSWGYGHREILTPCYEGNKPDGFYGPIHPTKNYTFAFLKKLFGEVASVFADRYIHLGGDEVSTSCWFSNPDVKAFIEKQGNGQVMQYYIQNLINTVLSVGKYRKQGIGNIVWQEVFDHGVQLNPDTIVQIWMGGAENLQRVIGQGQRAIFSSCWYLDHVHYGIEWPRHYLCDPLNEGRHIDESKMVGGEACMWMEYVDDTDLISRLWPRASAIAERLWSNKFVRNINQAAPRLEEHRCRMIYRGFNVGVLNGPGHCKQKIGKELPPDIDTGGMRPKQTHSFDSQEQVLNRLFKPVDYQDNMVNEVRIPSLEDNFNQMPWVQSPFLYILILFIGLAVIFVMVMQQRGFLHSRAPGKWRMFLIPPVRRKNLVILLVALIGFYAVWSLPMIIQTVSAGGAVKRVDMIEEVQAAVRKVKP
ncbi:beta-hexosaminidase subunit alpha-like isoform X2 [Lineus longissimus]|uniref:beta-hexosaminidase subunit alpha-like isoform X2 n=2 Tax=Lineus longissimus TaxID=88925 RepID=UPI00315DD2E5